MAECPQCLSQARDDAQFCPLCGGDMHGPPVGRQKRAVRYMVAIALAVVLVVGAVVAVSAVRTRVASAKAARELRAVLKAEMALSAEQVSARFAKSLIAGDNKQAAHWATGALQNAIPASGGAQTLLGPDPDAHYVALAGQSATEATCTRQNPAKPYLRLTRKDGEPWRVVEAGYIMIETRDEATTLAAKNVDDPKLPIGTTKVAVEGSDGMTRLKTRRIFVNGVPGAEAVLRRTVIKKPVARLTRTGTKTPLTLSAVKLGPVGADPEYGPTQVGPLTARIVAQAVRTTTLEEGQAMVVQLEVKNTGRRPLAVGTVAGYKMVRLEKDDWSGYWGSDRSVRYSDKAPGFGLQGSFKTTEVLQGAGDSFGQPDVQNEPLVVWPGKTGKGFFVVYFGVSESGDAVPPTPARGEDLVVGLQLEKEGYDESDSQYDRSETRWFLMPMSQFWEGTLP